MYGRKAEKPQKKWQKKEKNSAEKEVCRKPENDIFESGKPEKFKIAAKKGKLFWVVPS